MKKHLVLFVFSIFLGSCTFLSSLHAAFIPALKKEINELCRESERSLNHGVGNQHDVIKKKNYTAQLTKVDQTRSHLSLLSKQAQKVFLQVIVPLVLNYHVSSDYRTIVYAAPEKTPLLHRFVGKYAKDLEMPVPMLFISHDETLINAVALSFNHTISAVIIGKSLINGINAVPGFNASELASTIVHELVHIKEHHLLKRSIFFCAITSMYFMLEKYIAQEFVDFNQLEHTWHNRLLYLCMGSIALLATVQLPLPMPVHGNWKWKAPFRWYMWKGEVEANNTELKITRNIGAQNSSYYVMENLEYEVARSRLTIKPQQRSFYDRFIALFFEGQYHSS